MLSPLHTRLFLLPTVSAWVQLLKKDGIILLPLRKKTPRPDVIKSVRGHLIPKLSGRRLSKGHVREMQGAWTISRSALPLQRLGAGTDLSARVLGTRVAPTGHLENWHPCPRQDAELRSPAQVVTLPSSLQGQSGFSRQGSWEQAARELELNPCGVHQGQLHS